MHLHQIKIRHHNTSQMKTYHLTDWQDAKFVNDAAKGFGWQVVWWYRAAPEKPWQDMSKVKVANKDITAEGSPWRPLEPAPGEIATLPGPAGSGQRGNARLTTGISSGGSGKSTETGPGLEKP